MLQAWCEKQQRNFKADTAAAATPVVHAAAGKHPSENVNIQGQDRTAVAVPTAENDGQLQRDDVPQTA
jgi:hypothetical protein